MQNKKSTYEKRAFSIKEAAEYACVSEGTVRNWIVSEIIPFEELPSRGNGSHRFRLIRKCDLDNFLGKYYFHPHTGINKMKKNNLELLSIDSL